MFSGKRSHKRDLLRYISFLEFVSFRFRNDFSKPFFFEESFDLKLPFCNFARSLENIFQESNASRDMPSRTGKEELIVHFYLVVIHLQAKGWNVGWFVSTTLKQSIYISKPLNICWANWERDYGKSGDWKRKLCA